MLLIIVGWYLLAFIIVDSKTEDNWEWFLAEIYKIVDSDDIQFVSERNASLLVVMPLVFPNSNHYFCLQHLKCNLREKLSWSSVPRSIREGLVFLLRECAYAPTKELFYEKLDELKGKRGGAVDRFLEGLPHKNWVRAFSEGCRYGEISLNVAESFNTWILDVRDLPITHMTDKLRCKIMQWFDNRRQDAGS